MALKSGPSHKKPGWVVHRLRQIAGSMLKGFKAPFAFLTTVKVDSCAGVKIGIRLIAEYPVLDPAYQPENSDTGLAPLLLTSPLPLPDGSEVFRLFAFKGVEKI